MAKLIQFLIAGFATLIPTLIAFFSRKAVVATACLTAFVASTAALIVCIKSLVAAVVVYLYMPAWLAPMQWFIPPNMLALFSLIVSGRTCRAAYDIAIEKIKLISAAS